MAKKFSIMILGFLYISLIASVVSTAGPQESIIFKVSAANPSQTKTQSVPIEVYLPPEVKKDDVLNTAGLELKYDSEKSAYYLYKDDLELAPAQAISFDVRVKDVWIIPEKEIALLKEQTSHILRQLEKTPYYAQTQKTAQTIYKRLDKIASSQSDESISSAQHIEVYHLNTKVLEAVEKDISDMEQTQEGAIESLGWVERIKRFWRNIKK
ncbi:MAG: hypothetical protein JW869_01085 [Candidatus Omnitrophica bacterium]|nr:hypothetical protein [Candidatus Omnitrophota bacterium]